MNTPNRIETLLAMHGVTYEVVSHAYSASSLETARVAHIDPHRLAKAVLLERGEGFVAAVVAADREVALGHLRHDLGEDLHLASEADIKNLFNDCAPGAMPSLANAWGVDMVWEDELLGEPDLYFEAGDHLHLIHVETSDLKRVLAGTQRCHFSKSPRMH